MKNKRFLLIVAAKYEVNSEAEFQFTDIEVI